MQMFSFFLKENLKANQYKKSSGHNQHVGQYNRDDGRKLVSKEAQQESRRLESHVEQKKMQPREMGSILLPQQKQHNRVKEINNAIG